MSEYQGDIREDSFLHFKFLTKDSSDVPTTLLGTPSLRIYKDSSTTETTAGITLVVDFDSVTGLNAVTIDTSADSFYTIGGDYDVVIQAGTVSGSSRVGYTVGGFSIVNRSTIDIKADTQALQATFIKASGQAGGGTANTISLVGASAVEDFYRWDIVTLDDGASSAGGQSRLIIAYNGTTKVATVFPDWEIVPPTPNGSGALFKVIPGGLRSIYSLDGISLPVDANIIQIDGNTTDGNNATLNLKQLNIVNNGGDAIRAESTGGNGHGMNLEGDGSGRGLNVIGGDTADGVRFLGGASGGSGLRALGTVGFSAIRLDGQGGGPGLDCAGGTSAPGIFAQGGATSGDGIKAVANGGNSNGMSLVGNGTGKDIDANEIDLVKANVVEINSSTTAATNLALWMQTITTGFINEATPPTNGFQVVIDGGGTVTEGQLLIMQSSSSLGPGEARIISSDITASGALTLDKDLRAAPTDTDAFIVLPAGVGDDLLRLNTELAGAPAITSGLKDFIKWIFHLSKVKITETATVQTIRNDADSSTIATRAMSDDGTTFNSGKAT